MRALAMAVIGFALVATAPVAARSAVQADADAAVDRLRNLQRLDQRVADIAYRLKVAGVGQCALRAHDIGVTFHTAESYVDRFREVAVEQFGLDRGPALLAVAAGGPAQRAGLRSDDVVTAIDGVVPVTDSPRESGVVRVNAQLEAALSDGIVTIAYLRGGVADTVTVRGESICRSRVAMLPSARIDAAANGSIVQITSALVEYAADDAWLATVLAHELAHNFLQHRVRLDAQNIRRGLLGGFGRSGRLSREVEIEADRTGVRIMHRAGYPTAAAIRFWEAYRRDLGLGIFRSGTHPSERARIAAITQEIARIDRETPEPDIPGGATPGRGATPPWMPWPTWSGDPG